MEIPVFLSTTDYMQASRMVATILTQTSDYLGTFLNCLCFNFCWLKQQKPIFFLLTIHEPNFLSRFLPKHWKYHFCKKKNYPCSFACTYWHRIHCIKMHWFCLANIKLYFEHMRNIGSKETRKPLTYFNAAMQTRFVFAATDTRTKIFLSFFLSFLTGNPLCNV